VGLKDWRLLENAKPSPPVRNAIIENLNRKTARNLSDMGDVSIFMKELKQRFCPASPGPV